MKFEQMHPADQLVEMMARIYRFGMTTTSGGNISILDDNGDIWITPSGIDKGSLTRSDMMQVKPDGTVIGPHRPSVELPFHRHIYRIRPDIRAIVHAHPPTLVAYSLVRRIPRTDLTPDVSQFCGRVGMAKYEVPGSEKLGNYIAEEFEKGYDTVMMENHGVVCGAKDLSSAFKAFETLDFSARMELSAEKLGKVRVLTAAEIAEDGIFDPASMLEFVPGSMSSEERAGRRDICNMVHRCYQQKLFTCSEGTYSLRLSDGSFLITPVGYDRKYLEEEDIVLVKDGKRQAGKVPSRSVQLHQEIYATHEDVKSIVVGHPQAAMGFAVSDAEFDSRLIPESYIGLRSTKRMPYNCIQKDVKGTAAVFSSKVPVIIVDNQCVVCTGANLVNAFDRLEVLEYSAAALVASRDLGEVVLIKPDEVRDIEVAFNLN